MTSKFVDDNEEETLDCGEILLAEGWVQTLNTRLQNLQTADRTLAAAMESQNPTVAYNRSVTNMIATTRADINRVETALTAALAEIATLRDQYHVFLHRALEQLMAQVSQDSNLTTANTHWLDAPVIGASIPLPLGQHLPLPRLSVDAPQPATTRKRTCAATHPESTGFSKLK